MLEGVYLSLLIGPVVPVPAPRAVVDAMTSAQVTVSAGQRSGFQLTFGVSKNSDLSRTLIPAGYFDPMIRVILVATVNGTPEVLMDGLISRQQFAPSNEPGLSLLTVTGEDVSLAMDLIDTSGLPYPALPAEGRVALILAKYALFGVVPLIVPSILFDVPNPLEIIPKHQGTDLQYIAALAKNVGYVFYVEPGPVPGVNIAYWGPEIKVGPPQPALNVNMDAFSNVESISFTFDGLSKTLFLMSIQEPFTNAVIPIPIPDVTPLNPPLGLRPPVPLKVAFLNREPEGTGTAKYNPVQAALIGLAKAAQASDSVAASGSLDVFRYGRALHARQLVGVRGAGPAYDGLYYVKSVTHSIKRGEYKQNFSLSRNALISTLPTVPT